MSRHQIQTSANSLQEQLYSACVLEAAARKPGNVHPEASFCDLTFQHFHIAAKVASAELASATHLSVGTAVQNEVIQTREVTGTNVNLGIILLLAPLAAVPPEYDLVSGVQKILASLDMTETELIYSAIQTAQPGGMGEVADQDVAQPPTIMILDAMRLAADRDLIAKQYVTNFTDVFQGVETFLTWWDRCQNWETAVIGTHLSLMREHPDSLIARKCGVEIAATSSEMSGEVLDSGWPGTRQGEEKIQQLDDWLRADGHRRNPGTTADLIAAILFSTIRDRQWSPPIQIEFPNNISN